MTTSEQMELVLRAMKKRKEAESLLNISGNTTQHDAIMDAVIKAREELQVELLALNIEFKALIAAIHKREHDIDEQIKVKSIWTYYNEYLKDESIDGTIIDIANAYGFEWLLRGLEKNNIINSTDWDELD